MIRPSDLLSVVRGRPRSTVAAGMGVVLIGWWSLAGRPQGEGEPLGVERRELVLTAEIEGELAAVRSTMIGPPIVKNVWEYKIAMLAPESQEVKKGQPILAFDTQNLMQDLEQKRAELADFAKQAERQELELALEVEELELKIAEAEAKRGKAELDNDLPVELRPRIEARLAELDLRAAQVELEGARAELAGKRAAGEAKLRMLQGRAARARERVADLELAIASMTIAAPQDGIVIYRTDWNDEKKKVGDSVWIQDKVLELPDLSEMRADGEINEADAARVQVGQDVTLRLEARPDRDFAGRVEQIGSNVRLKSWRTPVKIYRLQIALEETDPQAMRPGMRFRGEVVTDRIPDVLTVPREAVFFRVSGPVVWREGAAGYSEVPVRVGRRNDKWVEVLEGLEEGDRVSPDDLAPPAADPRRTARSL